MYLLFDVEVLPCEVRIDVLLVELKDFVVANGARVGVVHDAGEFAPAHLDCHWYQLW